MLTDELSSKCVYSEVYYYSVKGEGLISSLQDSDDYHLKFTMFTVSCADKVHKHCGM